MLVVISSRTEAIFISELDYFSFLSFPFFLVSKVKNKSLLEFTPGEIASVLYAFVTTIYNQQISKSVNISEIRRRPPTDMNLLP